MANLQSYSDDFILGSLSVKSQKNQLHKFSPTLWTSLLFLLSVQRSSGEDSVPTKVVGILGGSVILSLNISVDTEIEHVIWSGPQKALALAKAGGEITILDKHTYQTQLNISSENYSLRISNLTMKNAGCYKAQINVKNSDVPTEQKFTLNVYVQRSSGEDSVPTKVVGILGGSVILSLNISVDTEIEHVIWSGPQKALALAKAGGEITILDKHTYQTQLNISSENYSLRISNLTMKNAGCYKAQINVKNSDVPTEQKFTLNVYGPAASGDLKKVVGAIGGSVTFPLNNSIMHVDSIVWIFNTTLATYQPQQNGNSALVTVTQSHKKERVSFPNDEYSLKLSKLQKNDSGIYGVEIHSSHQSLPTRSQKFVLHVYEHVSKPKVTIGLQNKKNGTCMANLTCSMEQQGEDVIYSWKSKEKAENESHEGAIFPISWRQGERNMIFICIARNPISRSFSDPISSWEICEGAGGDTDASMAFLYLPLVFLLCIVILILIIFRIQRDRIKEIIEEKKGMEIRQVIPNISSHSGENTLYDAISYTNKPTSEEDTMKTLYAIIQIPKPVEKSHTVPTTLDTAGLFPCETII